MTSTESTTSTVAESNSASPTFRCHICLESNISEPVVTTCGHLYCWPCLYRWLEKEVVCPLCKASVRQVIPIYATANEEQHRHAPNIPDRPKVSLSSPDRGRQLTSQGIAASFFFDFTEGPHAQQEYLSRMLLLLGSFVALCLLLF